MTFSPLLEPAPCVILRRCACAGGAESPCRCDEETKLRRSSTGAAPDVAPPLVSDVLSAPGEPLDASTRGDMERRFGHDFSRVRVHADARAADSARAVGALAYAVGQHVVFAAGRYAPGTSSGDRLLAHELAHTLQQRGAPAAPQASLAVGPVDDPAEREADRAAEAALAGGAPDVAERPAAVRRQPDPRVGRGGTLPRREAMQLLDCVDDLGEARAAECRQGVLGEAPGLAKQDEAPPCDPQPLARAEYLSRGFPADSFGFTSVSGTAGVPFSTSRVRGGVRVDPTTATMPPITSVYTRAGSFIDGTAHFVNHERDPTVCPTARYPVEWWIDGAGAARIREGEIEHCRDLRFAFERSLVRFAAAVNALAQSRRTFPSEAAAQRAVERAAGVPMAQWTSVFRCLASRTCLRDVRRWHTPVPRRMPPRFPECRAIRVSIHGGSLPQVGRHATPDVVRDCGEDGRTANPATSCQTQRAGGAVAMPVLRRFPEQGVHGPMIAEERRRMGFPESGRDEHGRRVGPTDGQIVRQYSVPAMFGALAGMTPWQLAHAPAGRFSLIERGGVPSAEVDDYRRAARLSDAILVHDLRLRSDPETVRLGEVGREPDARTELPALDAQLNRILATGNFRSLITAPGGRGVPVPPGSTAPSLRGHVRVITDRRTFRLKAYEVNRLLTENLVPGPEIQGKVQAIWQSLGATPAGTGRATPVERRLALFLILFIDSEPEAFYHPRDDVFYMGPRFNARDPGSLGVARHEMVHLLGGRERTRAAFQRRFGASYLFWWRGFEEGITDLVARESGPGLGGVYDEQVAWVQRIMRSTPGGRDLLLRAYFTGAGLDRVLDIVSQHGPPPR